MSSLPSRTQDGLTAAKAAELLRIDGPNVLPDAATRSQWRIIVDILREPMLAMLLGAGIVYMLLGSAGEAIVLVCFAGFSIIIAVVQESRTEHVLRSLRELAAPRAIVIRDGAPIRIPGREVVRGDVMLLEQGDRVAADAILLESDGLAVDESLLTGESVPVEKHVAPSPGASQLGSAEEDRSSLVYSSTLVTRGRATARVFGTGLHTELGQIGQSLADLQMEAPALRKQTMRIVRYAAAGAAIVTFTVVLLYGLLRGGWLDAVLAGIAIGMSLLPEEFPVVLTVFLAMGAWRISKAKVLTRRASAIESLGAATILCADKTGTLTRNRMAVSDLWRPDGDTITLSPSIVLSDDFHPLLAAGALASAAITADPMETALHDASAERAAGDFADWQIQRTFALSPDFLAMSNAWIRPDRPGVTVAAKGAPEAIADLCRLSVSERGAMDIAARAMADRGMRVLAVAEAQVEGELGVRQQDHVFRLHGLIGLSDPLRADIPEAIAQCRAAGIRVMMITGDYPATARAIAAQAGLADGDLLTGKEIEALSDRDLADRLATTSICARTMPSQKLRIVETLKRSGEVVAMTGDGVNDAPALKAAHIGIAMGKRGTDVAREAASIVLVEDDFSAIVEAIRLGRRIYDNLRKAMGFVLSAHIPIAGLALLPLMTGLPLLFGPIQIALIEMIIDPVCAIAFEAEPEEPDLMERPPRPAGESLFSAPMVVRGIIQGGMTFLLLALLFWGAVSMHVPEAEVRALLFFSLVVGLLALVLVNRAFSRSLLSALVRGNVALRYIGGGIALVTSIIVASPSARALLQFGPVHPIYIGIALATGALLLLLLEATKVGRLRYAR